MPISKPRSPENGVARRSSKTVTSVGALLLAATALSTDRADAGSPYLEPPERFVFDGKDDDLLTAGLGAAGLATPPTGADPERLTEWTERRRRAIHQNWRALVDLRRWSYGIDIRVAGVEYIAHVGSGGGVPGSSFLLQIPATFDPKKPCLLVTAASGSRGIYGSLPTVGQWGLRRGCAVVSDDKGLGMRVADSTNGWQVTATGRIESAPKIDTPFAHALQIAHAHTALDSEANWGRMLLRSGKHALQLLSTEFPQSKPFTPSNTLIIAAGISNGGAAVLQALEADDGKFFDGAVASEPNVHLQGSPSLYDYATLHAMLQPCAVLAENLAEIPLGMVIGMNRARYSDWCQRLTEDGWISGTDTSSRANAARQRLLDSGIEPSALRLGAVNLQFGLWTSVAATYAQNYLRRALTQPVCGLGFAATDASGRPRALTSAERASLFSDGTGIAPTAGINLVRVDAQGLTSSEPANSYDTAKCLRDVASQVAVATKRLAIRGKPGNRPVIVLHGSGDGLIPIAHTSRRYAERAAANNSKFRFLEVAKGQHFDAFLMIPGMEPSFTPMQPTVDQSLDNILSFLTNDQPLPSSGILD
jgi:hydroxybutyrate-dimer hydrolase